MIIPGDFDLGALVNLEHSLMHDLRAWWKVLPGVSGGSVLQNLSRSTHLLTGTGENEMELTNMPHATSWKGDSLEFDGSASYCDLMTSYGGLILHPGLAEHLEQTPFTFACWFNQRAATTGILTYHGRSGAADRFHRIYVQGTGEVVCSSQWNNAISVTVVGLNEWHFVVGVWYGTADRSVFLDGRFEKNNTGSNTNINYLNKTALGMSRDSSPSSPFNGHIREAMAWGRALADEEILDLYHRGVDGYPELINRVKVFWDIGSGGGGDEHLIQNAIDTIVLATSNGTVKHNNTLLQPAIDTVVLASSNGTVKHNNTLIQPAIDTIVLASSNGTVKHNQTLTQPAIDTVVLATSDGTVKHDTTLTQPAIDTIVTATSNGTVKHNNTLIQPAIDTIVLVSFNGIVLTGNHLVQPAIDTIVLASSNGTVKHNNTLIQPAIDTIVLASLNGTVISGSDEHLIQNAIDTIVLASSNGTISHDVHLVQPKVATIVLVANTGRLSAWLKTAIWDTEPKPGAKKLGWNSSHELAASIVTALAMDEGAGTTLADAKGGSFDGTIGTGAVGEESWVTDEVKHNPSVRADISIPAGVSAGLDSTFSWGLLIKILYEPLVADDGSSDYGEVRRPLKKIESASDSWGEFRHNGFFDLSSDLQERPLMVATIAGSPQDFGNPAAEEGPDWPDLNLDQWLHWHFTFDKDVGAKIYTNGILHRVLGASTGLMDLATSTPLELIAEYLSADGTQWLAMVADFKLGDRVWTEREIWRDYINPWDLYTSPETLLPGVYGETDLPGVYGVDVLPGVYPSETLLPGVFPIRSS